MPDSREPGGWAHDPAAEVQQRYRRFAEREAPGRSQIYRQWAAGIAADDVVARILARIPASHRQPPLVFAVARMLGSGLGDYATWAAWAIDNADRLVAQCLDRRVQTNEPLRCAAMLPALSVIDGPVALLEIGASAGLCLYPDRYSYRFRTDDGSTRRLDPADGPGSVVLDSRWVGPMPALRMPNVVWRAGIDLHPLNAADPDDRAWLVGLVWPEEHERRARIEAALQVAAADPPQLLSGDGLTLLTGLAAQAPAEATLVVTTPGVLVHVERSTRQLLADAAARAARWITLDPPGLHDAVRGAWHPESEPADWPNGAFALALDGHVRAAVDPLGARIQPLSSGLEWRPDSEASA